MTGLSRRPPERAAGRDDDAATCLRIERAQVDEDGLLHLDGWVASRLPIDRIQVFLGHQFLGLAELRTARADVGLAIPHDARDVRSGFHFLGDVGSEDLTGAVVHARALVVGGAAERASERLLVGALTHPPRPPHAIIDGACEHAVRSPDGTWSISGWAVGGTEVTLALDDAPGRPAKAGFSRPDIGNRFPRNPAARHAGFAFHGDLPHPVSIPRVLRITIATAAGHHSTLSHRLPTDSPQQTERGVSRDLANRIKFFLSTPHSAATFPPNTVLPVRGWAVAQAGIEAIDVFLDGKRIDRATLGLNRPDIGAAFPEWQGSGRSGFALTISPRHLRSGRHRLEVAVRDKAGGQVMTDVPFRVGPAQRPLATTVLRSRVPQAEIDLASALLADRGAAIRFLVIIKLTATDATTLELVRATERSLSEQAHAAWHVATHLPGQAWNIPKAATHVLVLRAGDRLGCDALMELALAASQTEADFIYADERRFDPILGVTLADFRPQWSPDLLLSTNYIGRTWCASTTLLAKCDIADCAGDHDLVLRLTEQARRIRHVPKILCETLRTVAPSKLDRAALRQALTRRGIAGDVRPGLVAGTHRVRRIVPQQLVSIVMPTCASNGLFRAAIESVRASCAGLPMELVAIDNIPADRVDDKKWLRAHADLVVDMPGPFNWSRFNNAGARAASGPILLFVNDDIEARDPAWLAALLEHVQRPEIGAVGARLLYPDGKLQHFGISLSPTGGLHPFRYMARQEGGPFGQAACVRNVSAVTGACLMVRKTVFDQLGGFDEAHPIINNDLDFCLRLRAAGFDLVVTPHAELIHHELASRAGLGEAHDAGKFRRVAGLALARGDPYHNPNLSRFLEDPIPEPEPTRISVVGHPLLAADTVRRILVLKLDHIGDFVTAVPALRRLQRRFPAARLDVLCHPSAAPLARQEPAIGEVIELSVFHPQSSAGRRRVAAEDMAAIGLRLADARYDIAIDLRKHPETRPVLRMTAARLLAGFDHDGAFPWLDVSLDWNGDAPRAGKRGPVGADLAALVEAVAIACEPQADAPWTRRASGRIRVCVHPAAGSPMKQWPPEHFAALMDMLAEDCDAEFVLIGGATERRVAARVLDRMTHADRVHMMVGDVDLAALPAVLLGCDLFVGNDSGPKHLAASLGVPTVGVHSGVVDPAEWGPVGPRAVAVHRQMACSPCYLTKLSACPRGLACLRQLLPADVAAACRRILVSPG